uniref:Uncharacterized protein n=1 Tax=Micrurus lemniscatus lemniscatus TaxID=129467 RepID=A0A2D4I7C8_MICLE
MINFSCPDTVWVCSQKLELKRGLKIYLKGKVSPAQSCLTLGTGVHLHFLVERSQCCPNTFLWSCVQRDYKLRCTKSCSKSICNPKNCIRVYSVCYFRKPFQYKLKTTG